MSDDIESKVLNGLKELRWQYQEGIPVNILKIDLGLSDDDLKASLLSLADQGVIFIEEETIQLVEDTPENDILEENTTYKKQSNDVNESILDDKLNDLTDNELEAYNLIKDLTDDSGKISKYLLEGNLLYGDLKLSTLSTFNIIVALERKELIKRIQLSDGEYYRI